jgi:aminomethyltransferase
MVEFGGWSMPVQYSSIIDEHKAVRERAGLFDISHMGRLAFRGPDALAWLESVTTNHVAKLSNGQIQYSLITDAKGGILDDVLVERRENGYAMVCNASNRTVVVAHLDRHRPPGQADFQDRTLETAMLALQGPSALAVIESLSNRPLADLRYYHATQRMVAGIDATVSRTGYTGEDGVELIVPAPVALKLWTAILDAGQSSGVVPCGLGARDTLRFEAGMPLYGHELDATINPFEAGVGWVVKLKKGDFVGRDALVKIKPNVSRTRVGLALGGKRIARQGCPVLQDGKPVGAVTSGTFAPTLGRSLAMALIPNEAAAIGTRLDIDVRGTSEPAEVVPLPFYKRADR